MASLIHDTKLNGLISKMPALANATAIIPLKGGLTNKNYRIDTPTNSYVMRISDKATSLLGIDRENERINTARAHEAGVGAAVVDCLTEENILLIDWIEAKTLHGEDIRSKKELLPRIANALRKLHAGAAFHRNFYFPDVRKEYLKIVLANNHFLPDGYLKAAPLISALEEELASRSEPFVPCNNDLLAENFMDDGEKIWIIDYEYSGQNEASFEIGNLASEIFLGDEQLAILCDAYWQEYLPEKIYRAIAWSMIARFGWVMWASIQEAVSVIDFDFRAWGLKKWDSVLPEIAGNRYKEVLVQLKKYNS